MKKIRTVIFLAVAVLSSSAYAADKKHPIDAQLDSCLAKQENMTAARMTNCMFPVRPVPGAA
jgi:hypothetical protein